jgi:thioredoxin-like negative regulator of GroEL
MKTEITTRQRAGLPVWGRYVIVFAVVSVCGYGALASARTGLSRLFSEYGSATESLAASERALSFNPRDPEAHYARALRLADEGRNEEAVRELEQAAALRSQDYFLWQELARAREANDDTEGAIRALQEAIALAPDYAQPHWQMGNLLLRASQSDQGFAELRLAANSDPSLYAPMIDLAWSFHEGDAPAMLVLGKPRNDNERILLASFFANRDRVDEAMQLLRPIVTTITAEDRESLTAVLTTAGKFSQAFEVWSAGTGAVDDTAGQRAKIFDGGFEGTINANEQGFGWKPTQATATVHILLDGNLPQSGQRSLRLDYAGGFDPAVAVISQLVIVAPHTRYRLSFSARTEDLKSAALPLVAVKNADGSQQINVQSSPLAGTGGGWREFALEFETADAAAITINIQRQACSSNPCPIFGRAWFDSFSLKQL